MSPFHHHAKASPEVSTPTETSSISKDTDAAIPQAESDSTHTNQPKTNPCGAGPARENLTTPRAPVSDGLVHEQKDPKEKHHFWQHTKHRSDDHAQQMEYLKSRGFDEERAKQAIKNVERERHDSGRRKSLADKILGPLPAEDDPLSRGNLGQGLVWR